eukprot:2525763-Rhodomonas_salina.1
MGHVWGWTRSGCFESLSVDRASPMMAERENAEAGERNLEAKQAARVAQDLLPMGIARGGSATRSSTSQAPSRSI